jgi:trk system potassium uptake protein
LAGIGFAPLIVAWFDGESLRPWWAVILLALGSGLILFLIGRKGRAEQMGIKEGMAVTTLCWLAISLVASFGFWLGAPGTRFMQAWFEAMSGLTTTGSSIYGGYQIGEQSFGIAIEQLSQSVRLWRAILHWIGGIGIVVISIALIPLLVGGSGFQMYRAEVPGLSADRLAPRIANTARILLGFYAILTLVGVVGLWLCGIGWYDAICHSFATVSTGGFSTYDNSIEGLGSAAAEWFIIFGMLTAGLNFSLLITAARGRPLRLLQSTETKVFLGMVLTAWVLLILSLGTHSQLYEGHLHDLLRDTLFQTVSLCTSTGFGTGYDTVGLGWDGWPDGARLILLLCMIIGGCAGSTAGGIKVVRLVIAWLAARRELRRFMEPARITPVTIDGQPLKDRTILQVFAFVLIFAIFWLAGTAAFAWLGHQHDVATSASLSALSNMGPGIGAIGSSKNFGIFDDASLTVSIFLMLLGRLEFFGVLIALHPGHWSKN